MEELLEKIFCVLVDIQTCLEEMRDMMRAQREMAAQAMRRSEEGQGMIDRLLASLPPEAKKQMAPLMAMMGRKDGQ